MADSPLSFVLDLDANEFNSAAQGALQSIQKIGDSKNLSGLAEGLGELLVPLGAVGLAFEGFKGAMDLTIEGEQIQRTQQSFENLATQAGISGIELKKGLEDAAGGLIPMNDLLKIANKAIIAMGASAQNLPQILELARKASVATGESVETVFSGMVEAIEHANTRQLKHYGIVIDQNKAYQDMADKLGITKNELSEAGKQQAILDAALQQGGKSLGGINGGMQGVTEAVQQLKTAINELKDVLAVVFEKVLGRQVAAASHGIANLATSVKEHLVAAFSSGSEQSAAKIAILKGKIADTQASLESFRKMGSGSLVDTQMAEARLKKLQAQLDALTKTQQVEQKQTADKEKENIAEVTKAEDGAQKNRLVNTEQQKKDRLAFNAELKKLNAEAAADSIKQQQAVLKAEQEADKQSISNIKDADRIEKEIKDAKVLREKINAENIAKINTDFNNRALQESAQIEKVKEQYAANDKRRAEEIAAIKIKYANDVATKQKLLDLEKERFDNQEMARARQDNQLRIQLDQQYLNNSQTIFQGVSRAAKKMSDQARADLQDFGKQGDMIMASFQKNSVSAFENIGTAMASGANVAQATAQAMESAFLKMIGEVAEKYGTMILLESIFPPNPVGIAAGGALIAFGAAVSSLAGGIGGSGGAGAGVSTSGGGGGGGGGGGSAPTPSTQNNQQQLQGQQLVQRSVNVNIAGNYLNTQETQRSLMEIMRNETDATGFQYNKIGV